MQTLAQQLLKTMANENPMDVLKAVALGMYEDDPDDDDIQQQEDDQNQLISRQLMHLLTTAIVWYERQLENSYSQGTGKAFHMAASSANIIFEERREAFLAALVTS